MNGEFLSRNTVILRGIMLSEGFVFAYLQKALCHAIVFQKTGNSKSSGRRESNPV